MEVVVRTASGDAELTLGERPGAATVGAVVERVSGQPAPALLYVDGRAVPSSTFLADSIVRNGSVIDTREPSPNPPADALVELIQIAGPGSGARRWLPAGRYRLGPGRKVNADELTIAPVERGALDIDVDPGGSVLLLGRDSSARIDGRPLPDDATTLWTGEWLDVAGRVFTYRHRSDLPRSVELPEPSPTTGRIIFNRPPRRLPEAPPPALVLPSTEPMPGGFSSVLRDFADRVHERRQEERTRLRGLRHHMAEAIELATTASPLLWRVRPSHVDAFHVPIGIADVPDVPAYERKGAPLPAAEALVRDPGALNLVPVTIDFGAEQGIGLVGDADASLATARGTLLQAVVEHGPADLDIVVATNTERRHAWEWVKWLPHARLDGHPNILATADQVAGWADSTVRTIEARSAEERRGLESPHPRGGRRRPLGGATATLPCARCCAIPTVPLRYLVLGRDSSEVPAACTTIVTTTPGSTGVVDHVAQGRRLERAFLFEVDEALATDTARSLAALDDPDVPETTTAALPANVPLLPLHGVASVDALTERHEHEVSDATTTYRCAQHRSV